MLDKILYDDVSSRHEYVIFSDAARKKSIPQYLDNRHIYGRISFAEDEVAFNKEVWLHEFQPLKQAPSEQIETVFTHIYQEGAWAKNQSGKGSSGVGSTAKNTKLYRDYLSQFLKTHQITSVVDLGCGDGEFSRLLDWTGIDYTGYDVVKSIIESNKEQHASSSIHFVNGNFLNMDLPQADLLVCKDVLQHLPNGDIAFFLPQLKKYKYCLITNDIDPQNLTSNNCNVDVGGYRSIDLTKPPFNLIGKKVFTFTSGMVKKQVLFIENKNLSKS